MTFDQDMTDHYWLLVAFCFRCHATDLTKNALLSLPIDQGLLKLDEMMPPNSAVCADLAD